MGRRPSRTAHEIEHEHAGLVESILQAGGYDARREAFAIRLRGVHDELESLSASCPSPSIRTPSAASAVVRRPERALAGIVASDSPSNPILDRLAAARSL